MMKILFLPVYERQCFRRPFLNILEGRRCRKMHAVDLTGKATSRKGCSAKSLKVVHGDDSTAA